LQYSRGPLGAAGALQLISAKPPHLVVSGSADAIGAAAKPAPKKSENAAPDKADFHLDVIG
jgi:hypothetical protein